MDIVPLVGGLLLLFAALFITEFLSRPPSLTKYIRHFTKQIDDLKELIGKQLTPAFEEATLAIQDFASVLNRARRNDGI